MATKNKFYGKSLNRDADQWVYFERFLNTLNLRVVDGYLCMSNALKEDLEGIQDLSRGD